MFRTLVSYLIIFAILFPDAARCGGVWGKEADDDIHPPRSIKRLSVQKHFSTDRQDVEQIPLISQRKDTDSTFLPCLPRNFEEIAKGQSLPQIGSKKFKLISAVVDTSQETSPTSKKTSKGKGVREEEDEGSTPSDQLMGEDQGKQTENGNQGELTVKRTSLVDLLNKEEDENDSCVVPLDNSSDLLLYNLSHEHFQTFIQQWVKEKNPTHQQMILVLSSLDDPDVGSATKKCLTYIQEKIIEGKLNKKQMASLLLGLGTGAGVGAFTAANLFRIIIVDFNLYFDLMMWLSDHNLDPLSIFFTVGSVSISALGISSASRMTSLLSDLMKDSPQPFVLQKTKIHSGILGLTKAFLYGSSSIVGLLPGYYLYSLLSNINNGKLPSMPLSVELAIGSLFAATFIDTILQYGHQLSSPLERRINGYFFQKMKEELPLPNAEILRQKYLQLFKDIKRIIYESDEDDLSNLYDTIFKKKAETAGGESDEDIKNWNIKEALRILQALIHFSFDKRPAHDLDSETWKTTGASWTGWSLTLLATVARHITFWFVVDAILRDIQSNFGLPNLVRDSLSITFGGVIAGFIQGALEKNATEAVTYDLLRGKKIPNGSSQYPLRLGIKAWDYFAAVICTLPYIVAGINAFNDISWYKTWWPVWLQIACLIPFGLADTFSKAAGFHNSNLNILNGVNSAISYGYPFEGYKRDKLIRITRQLRKLFKELDPDVLETVDKLLNGERRLPSRRKPIQNYQ